ncbi:MAG: sodium:solute symporter family protein [Nanoarchaeota archaeon]
MSNTLTIIVLIVYLAFMFGIAWYFSRKESLEAYFLNKRKTGLWFLALSSVATMVGAGSTVAIVSETYNTGISYGIAIPIAGVAGALILGFVAKRIKSFGEKHHAYTLVDFFEKRFDTKNKILSFFLQIFLMISWTATQAIAIAALATILVGVNYNFALFLAAAVTILYTAIGGMKIDFITDFIQFWIILIVFLILAGFGYSEVGSFSSLIGQLPSGHLDPFAFGGVSWFVALIIFSGFLFLGGSHTWQRIVSAKSGRTARKSFFIAIPLLLAIGLIVLFLGMLSKVLLGDINPDTAIFTLIDSILPPYLVGVGLAAILAAIMSSVDSNLIGGSTIVFRAIFRTREFSGRKEVLYARLITIFFGIISFGIAFLVPKIVTMALFSTYLAVIIAIPVMFGLYWKKLSANASFYALLLSTISLLILFPILREMSFVVPMILTLGILIFYDKIFKKKDKTLLEIAGFEE